MSHDRSTSRPTGICRPGVDFYLDSVASDSLGNYGPHACRAAKGLRRCRALVHGELTPPDGCPAPSYQSRVLARETLDQIVDGHVAALAI